MRRVQIDNAARAAAFATSTDAGSQSPTICQCAPTRTHNSTYTSPQPLGVRSLSCVYK
jgi:hypothetical protein